MRQTPDSPGLRARKKAETRERIHKAGLELFARQGFAATTVAQIAAAADVAPRTVHEHYPTKEDIVFGDVPGALAALAAELDALPRAPAGEVMRIWLHRAAAGWLEPDVEVQHRLAAEVPSIAERKIQVVERLRAPLVERFAADKGRPAGDLRAQLTAAAVITGLLHLEEMAAERLRSRGSVPGAAELDEVVDLVERFVEAGLSAVAD